MLQIVDRPGQFGQKRVKRVEFYDNLFGMGHWFEMWEVNGHTINFERAVALYDDSYHAHLQANPDLVRYVQSFGECYDYDPANIRCGCEHDQQSCPRHLQDISVRRALKRLGVWFEGPKDSLLQIRDIGSNGFFLHPGQVPFIHPELILTNGRCGKKPEWAKDGSVEHFWQANKVIAVESC